MRCAILLTVIGVMPAMAMGQTTRTDGEYAPSKITLPKPGHMPKARRMPRLVEVPKEPMLLAPTGTVNLALNRPVTSSDKEPIIGELKMITDGEKDFGEGFLVELGPGRQWVQIDLGKSCEIWGVAVWHLLRAEHEPRVYRDVVVQVSDDVAFVRGVKTLFNNDADGSCGIGEGKDNEYVESRLGKLVLAGGIKARYVRLWSNGNTIDDQNHYSEIEVYGIEARKASTRPAGEPKVPVEIKLPKPVLTGLHSPLDELTARIG